MRNIFLFIRRYFNFLFFLVLQVVSLYFIVTYSRYHEASFKNLAGTVTGSVNQRYSRVEQYFHLKKTNDSLVKANERLYNMLRENYHIPDSLPFTVLDTIRLDSLRTYRKIQYSHARVISNSVSAQNNFIVLSRGSLQGLREGMGVVDVNRHVVGIITSLTPDYAVVMSLLHKDSRISGKLLKGGQVGTLIWDGRQPNLVTLTNIPRSAKISKGDSVVTSGFSTTFPGGMLIGRVEGVYTDPSSNYYKVKCFTAANFYTLQFVYAILNQDQQAVNQILDQLKKQP